MLAGWAASLLTSTLWLSAVVGWGNEVIGGGVAHVVALPVIRLSPRLMPSIGCAVMGVLFGLLLVDTCFDLMVLREGSVRLGPRQTTPGREIAFYYYHVMLNELHINGVLWTAMLVLVLAAARGLEYAGLAQSRLWVRLVAQSSSTNGLYLYCVVPRYLAIRAATSYDPAFFDGWGAVLAARIVLMLSIVHAATSCIRLTLEPPGRAAAGKGE